MCVLNNHIHFPGSSTHLGGKVQSQLCIFHLEFLAPDSCHVLEASAVMGKVLCGVWSVNAGKKITFWSVRP